MRSRCRSHDDAHAELAQPDERCHHPGAVAHQCGLGDLKFQPLWRQRRLGKNAGYLIIEIGQHELHRRYIDGYR